MSSFTILVITTTLLVMQPNGRTTKQQTVEHVTQEGLTTELCEAMALKLNERYRLDKIGAKARCITVTGEGAS